MSATLLDSAIKSLHIQHVLLRNVTQAIAPEFEPGLGPQPRMGLQLRHRPLERMGMTIQGSDGNVDVVRFQYECGIRFVDVGQETDPAPAPTTEAKVLAELVAVFSVDYVESAGAEISDEAIELFGKRNVGYHVWPYWRELVQSQAARAMLPLPVIPFYQAPKD